MHEKILITGGSGLLGQYLNLFLSNKFELLTTYFNNKGNCSYFLSAQIDIRDNKKLEGIFSSFKPDVVIHTAAITNPIIKQGQSGKDYFDINVSATKNIAELCNQFGTKLIYISTDLVYAGYRGSMLKEDAKLIPVSLYAETKLMGEVKIKETFENYLILRTALLYGFGLNHSRCHFNKMNDELKNNKPVKLFTDQFRTPILLQEVADIISKIAEMDILKETINLGGTERVSRYELGEILCSVAGYDKSLLQKISLNDVPELPKVEDVSLNTDKLQSLGFKRKSIEENILRIIE
jgi:dTDP-4-dehydrorhamnose reductase